MRAPQDNTPEDHPRNEARVHDQERPSRDPEVIPPQKPDNPSVVPPEEPPTEEPQKPEIQPVPEPPVRYPDKPEITQPGHGHA